MEAIAKGEPNKRGFTYLMLGGMRVAFATSGRVAVLKLLGVLSQRNFFVPAAQRRRACISGGCLLAMVGGAGGQLRQHATWLLGDRAHAPHTLPTRSLTTNCPYPPPHSRTVNTCLPARHVRSFGTAHHPIGLGQTP